MELGGGKMLILPQWKKQQHTSLQQTDSARSQFDCLNALLKVQTTVNSLRAIETQPHLTDRMADYTANA